MTKDVDLSIAGDPPSRLLFGDEGSNNRGWRKSETGDMGGAPPLASSSSLMSGVRERPSESEKLFSRGIAENRREMTVATLSKRVAALEGRK